MRLILILFSLVVHSVTSTSLWSTLISSNLVFPSLTYPMLNIPLGFMGLVLLGVSMYSFFNVFSFLSYPTASVTTILSTDTAGYKQNVTSS